MIAQIRPITLDTAQLRFKDGARIPVGVTVEGVLTERDLIIRRKGKAHAELAAAAILERPDDFPNLRAFAPDTAEEALREAVANGFRYAMRVVVKVLPAVSGVTEPREVRIFFAVPDAEGEKVYERVEIIRESPREKAYLLDELSRDAETFHKKMLDVLGELRELV